MRLEIKVECEDEMDESIWHVYMQVMDEVEKLEDKQDVLLLWTTILAQTKRTRRTISKMKGDWNAN